MISLTWIAVPARPASSSRPRDTPPGLVTSGRLVAGTGFRHPGRQPSPDRAPYFKVRAGLADLRAFADPGLFLR